MSHYSGCLYNESISEGSQSSAGIYWRLDCSGSRKSHDYEYDIFLAYASEDLDFVQDHIISRLDKSYSGSYKCCYEHKNFLPGTSYSQCIQEALRKSFRIFVVLSQAYVAGGYCDFLLRSAIHYGWVKKIVPLRIDDCKIPNEIADHVSVDFQTLEPGEFYSRLHQIVTQATEGEVLLPDKRSIISKPRTHPADKPSGLVRKKIERIISDGGTESDLGRGVSRLGDRESLDYVGMKCPDPQFRQTWPDPTVNAGLYIRSCGPVDGDEYGGAGLTGPWSCQSFHEDPQAYVSKFCRVNPSSRLFSQVEQMLLREVLTQHAATGCCGQVTYSRLSCCPSSVIKYCALTELESCLMEENACSSCSAGGLKEAEEILRESFMGSVFENEMQEYQGRRVKVYGQLLFLLAMHVEKMHLTIMSSRLTKIKQVISILEELDSKNKQLTCDMKYSLRFTQVAYRYLSELFEELGMQVTKDQLSQMIQEVTAVPVSKYEFYHPWRSLDSQLNNRIKLWYLMDVMLSSVTNLVFQTSGCIHVLLAHLKLLLKPRPDVDQVCKYGVLLCIARCLVKIATTHPDRDVRLKSVFGVERPRDPQPGLCHIWNCDFLKSLPTFAESLAKIVRPLVFKAKDKKIRQEVARRYFEESKGPCGSGGRDADRVSSPDNNLVQRTMENYLRIMYMNVGHLLMYRPQPLHCSSESGVVIHEGILNNTRVAVKTPRLATMKRVIWAEDDYVSTVVLNLEQDGLWNEIQILSRLNHRHVVELLCKPDPQLLPQHGIFEFMDGGTLTKYLQNSRGTQPGISTYQILQIATELADALLFLSHKRIVHRDICGSNVLLKKAVDSPQWMCKLAGFGLARQLLNKSSYEGQEHEKIPLRWSAPESFYNNMFSLQSDMWMFGCTLVEAFTYGCAPFLECQKAAEVYKFVERGHQLEHPLCIPSAIHSTIVLCLAREPYKRCRIKDILCELTLLQDSYTEPAESCLSPPEPKYPLVEKRTPALVTTCKYDGCGAMPVPTTSDLWASTTQSSQHISVERTSEIHSLSSEVAEKLQQLNHPNLLLPPCSSSSNQVDCPMNILQYILKHRKCISLEHLVDVMVQVGSALAYLHSRHLVHTDLQAEYVRIAADINPAKRPKGYIHVKLGGLENCQVLINNHVFKPFQPKTQSLRWQPLEVLCYKSPFYSPASDVYSFSLLAWQMLCALEVPSSVKWQQIVPYINWPPDKDMIQQNLMFCLRPPQPVHCPDWLHLVLRKCQQQHLHRPPLDLILNCLTTRIPFQSQLLRGFYKLCQTKVSAFLGSIDLQATQHDGAPYLQQHPIPAGTQAGDSMLSAEVEEDEKELYFMEGSLYAARLETESAQEIHSLAGHVSQACKPYEMDSKDTDKDDKESQKSKIKKAKRTSGLQKGKETSKAEGIPVDKVDQITEVSPEVHSPSPRPISASDIDPYYVVQASGRIASMSRSDGVITVDDGYLDTESVPPGDIHFSNERQNPPQTYGKNLDDTNSVFSCSRSEPVSYHSLGQGRDSRMAEKDVPSCTSDVTLQHRSGDNIPSHTCTSKSGALSNQGLSESESMASDSRRRHLSGNVGRVFSVDILDDNMAKTTVDTKLALCSGGSMVQMTPGDRRVTYCRDQGQLREASSSIVSPIDGPAVNSHLSSCSVTNFGPLQAYPNSCRTSADAQAASLQMPLTSTEGHSQFMGSTHTKVETKCPDTAYSEISSGRLSKEGDQGRLSHTEHASGSMDRTIHDHAEREGDKSNSLQQIHACMYASSNYERFNKKEKNNNQERSVVSEPALVNMPDLIEDSQSRLISVDLAEFKRTLDMGKEPESAAETLEVVDATPHGTEQKPESEISKNNHVSLECDTNPDELPLTIPVPVKAELDSATFFSQGGMVISGGTFGTHHVLDSHDADSSSS